MDVSLVGHDGTTPRITMALSGQVNHHLKVGHIGEMLWEQLEDVFYYKAYLGSGEARRFKQCYYPMRMSSQDARKLRDLYRIFSIPTQAQPDRIWRNMKLCSVFEDWYLFFGMQRLSKQSYILTHPALMRRANGQRLRQPSLIRQVQGSEQQIVASEMASAKTVAPVNRLGVTATEDGNLSLGSKEVGGVEPEREAPSQALLVKIPLPAGSLLNYEEAGNLHTVCLMLSTEEPGGHILGILTIISTSSEPSNESSRYFQFQDKTEDTPSGNVLALPEMRLEVGGSDGCYMFASHAKPEQQVGLDTSLEAAGRAFGINNLTRNSVVLCKTGHEGDENLIFDLRLGTSTSRTDQPDLTVRLGYVHPLTDATDNVIGSQSRSAPAPWRGEIRKEADRGRKRPHDMADAGEGNTKAMKMFQSS